MTLLILFCLVCGGCVLAVKVMSKPSGGAGGAVAGAIRGFMGK